MHDSLLGDEEQFCLLCSLSATAEFGKWVYVCVSTVVFFVDH